MRSQSQLRNDKTIMMQYFCFCEMVQRIQIILNLHLIRLRMSLKSSRLNSFILDDGLSVMESGSSRSLFGGGGGGDL